MSIRLGDIAPDFEQDSSEGRIRFHEWLGSSWGVLFSHPADFTPVCTTELGFTAKLKDQFAARGVKVIALSVDPVDSHHRWIDDINDTQGTLVNFPIIADADRKVSDLYDLIHPNANDTLTVRSLFIIDPTSGRLTEIARYTPLYQRYSADVRLSRIYVRPDQAEAAQKVLP